MDNRVKLLRKQLKMSQNAFGARLGVSGAGISKIESGQRNLTEQMIILICKEYNIKEQWLKYGEGDIFKEKLFSGLDLLEEYYRLDEMDIKIILEFVQLDEKKRKVIKEYIKKVASFNLSSDIMSDSEIKGEILRCAEEPEYQ